MNFRLLPGKELDAGLATRWAEIQQLDPRFASPYFRPEFTQSVAAVRDDAWICVLESGNRVVGFFPFHRQWGGIGRPIGLGLSDHHGVIVEADVEWDVAELLGAAGLVRYEFDHLLAEQQQWAHLHQRVARSPIIETGAGYEAYEAVRNEMNGRQLKDAYRCIRKLEREHEAHRFTADSFDAAAFDAAIEWKRTQCQRTGVEDYFAIPWTIELLRELHARQSEDFAGILSTVHVGETLVAVHFGMRSRDVLHFWFPSYRPDYASYSPGSILLVELIRHACEAGMAHIDLGKGMAQYKERFMTSKVMVAEGVATRPALVNELYRLRAKTEAWGKNSALRPLLRWPGRLIKKLDRRGRFE